eukprot:TRINITY_DN793_c0_g1_i1.p1 TRINITY_DN793_c0_g1~~TRINITY_DN793_c0_g1_i1.p1  ORF type:complete len:464 (-),score=108.03 TRINITY_DN793_c0_g1_i1:406-1797(-)
MPSSRRTARVKAAQGGNDVDKTELKGSSSSSIAEAMESPKSLDKTEAKGSSSISEARASPKSVEAKGLDNSTIESEIEEAIDNGDIDMEGVENMEDVLRMAAKIKMAHMADLRKEWDLAPQFMKNTLVLHKDPQVANARLLPGKERLEAASQLKNEGNEAYNRGENVTAIQEYTKALSTFRYFVKDGDRFDLVNAHDSYGPEERAEMERLLVNIYVNLAVCLLRSKEPEAAMYACNEALKMDEGNMKALYRRAMARAMMEITTETLDLIIRDLSSAAFADPSNQDVKSALRKFRHARAEVQESARKDFGGMFERGEIYNQSGKADSGVRKRPGINEEGSGELDAERWAEDARRMGINLNDTWVKKKLERMRNKGKPGYSSPKSEAGESKMPSVVPPWRRKMYTHFDRIFDKTRWLSLPTLMKAIIVVNICYRFFTLWHMWHASGGEEDAPEDVKLVVDPEEAM